MSSFHQTGLANWQHNVARIDAHAESAHFPMRRIMMAWEAQGHFPGSDNAPSCEMCDFCMGIGSCYRPNSGPIRHVHGVQIPYIHPRFHSDDIV